MKSSRRYLFDEFDKIKCLPDVSEVGDISDTLKIDHTAEIRQDIIPQNHHSKQDIQTDASEFRKLPQLDSFESGQINLEPAPKGSSHQMQANGDNDDPPVRLSTVPADLNGLLSKDLLDSKVFFSRQQHRTLLSSIEFHSGVKEI